MNEHKSDFSRVGRKKNRNRSNKILNILIGVVVVLIIVFAATILSDDKEDEQSTGDTTTETQQEETNSTEKSEPETDGLTVVEDENKEEPSGSDQSDSSTESTSDGEKSDEQTEESKSEETTEEPVKVQSSDADVSESIIDPSWKPIGTSQTGEHTSQYDGSSVDWNEKKRALAYATGLPEESMIFWKIKNGGGPQKSIGIVSSKDSKEKYRVYLEWVDGEGWKPVKKDVLTTLEVKD